MSESIPSVAERITERVRALRAMSGWDQGAVAELLTALGAPTNPSTVARIERGAQAPSVEQALLLGMLSGAGLRGLLEPPFTVGSLTVSSADDVEGLLRWWQRGSVGQLRGSPLLGEYARATQGVWADQRDRLIARSLRADPEDVKATALGLYGRRASAEIDARFKSRLADLDPQPEKESPRWRAFRSHCVRAVAKEIGEALA